MIVARIVLLASVVTVFALLLLAFYPREEDERRSEDPIALMKEAGVPANLRQTYYTSAQEEGVDWRLLVAIGAAETDHGRSPLPGVRSGLNLAGCCAGVMQICTEKSCGRVWQNFAVDKNGNGKKSPYEAPDSIATAASYLAWMGTFLEKDTAILAAAYNAGPTLVQEEGIPNYPETLGYLQKIRATYAALKEKEQTGKSGDI